MRKSLLLIALALLFCLSPLIVAQTEEPVTSTQVWVGANFTDFSDYRKKVMEYGPTDDDVDPELGINYLSIGPNSIMRFNGRYVDRENMFGDFSTTVSDIFKAKVLLRSFTRNLGQDLLENIEAREFLGYVPDPANPGDSIQSLGGKYLTHELTDAGVDYFVNRDEILSQFEVLLSHKHNVRLVAAHRSILEKGSEQKIANDHCFSCHLTSREARVDKKTHMIEAGIEAEVGGYDLGYMFGYRKFRSEATDVSAYYDPAIHPTNGGSGAEFTTRVNYDDVTLPYSVEPEIEKMSHKVRVKGNLGSGRFSSAVGYSRTENKKTELAAKAWTGALNYTVPLSPKMRLVARASGLKQRSDDPFIDLPTFRDGRPGVTQSFDYTRYSALDRMVAKGSAELITRLNPKATLSILAGLKRTDRYDYPELDNGIVSNQFFGQARLNYRKGLRYATSLKYRFEKTSDPWVSGRGMFEASGWDTPSIWRQLPGFAFIFYYQREDLRYQQITTLPTDEHQIVWNSNYRPNLKTTLNLGVRAKFDKNGDLDSLDVKHSMIQPNLTLTYTPDAKLALSAGYTYDLSKSRLPATVALFDG